MTSASIGIGRRFAGMLTRADARLTLGARWAEAPAETFERVEAEDSQAQAVVMDVTNLASIERTCDTAEERFGPVAIPVSNAGLTVTRPALDLSESDWDSVVDTNLDGVRLAARATANRMVTHGRGGSIVNVASILGLRVAEAVEPDTVSKASVVQFTKVLAHEWARHGIRMSALAPGDIQTELNDTVFESDAGEALMKRMSERRLGAAVELLVPSLLRASDAGSDMTGSVVAVDGGHLISSL